MAILNNGQLPTVAAAIVTGSNLPGNVGTRVGLTLNNTSGSLTETILLTYVPSGGTARRIKRIILAANEQAVVSNIVLMPGDTINGVTTDATTVDYVAYEDSGEGPSAVVQVFDANGYGKTSNTGTITGTSTTITSSNANALAVGPNGTTNPAFNVDASTASSATGINIKSAAAAAGVAVSVITSGTNENLTIDAAGSGTITLNGTGTGAVIIGHNLQITDAKNVVLATTTGTQIATATTQKLGFYGATPVVQPTASTNATTGTTGASTGVSLDTTFTGGTGASAYTIGGVVLRLKNLGLIAA